MAVRKFKLIDATPTTNVASSGSRDLEGISPQRITLLVKLVKNASPPNLTLTVEVSPDVGITLIDYDKLLDNSGTDAPVSSVVYSASAEDVLSFSPEDIIDYLKVTLTHAAGTVDATNFWNIDVWAIIEY